MEVIVTNVSQLVYNLLTGLTTYRYRGYNPFTKSPMDIPGFLDHSSTHRIFCMAYLPTLVDFYSNCRINVGIYAIHGSYGV